MLQYKLNERYDFNAYIPLGDYVSPTSPINKYRDDIIGISLVGLEAPRRTFYVPTELLFKTFVESERYDLVDMLSNGGKVVVSSAMKYKIASRFPEVLL